MSFDSSLPRSPEPAVQYVGYRPLSAKQRHTLALLVPALLALLAFIAFVLAASQRDPGSGSWDLRITEHTGSLTRSPVPILWIDNAQGSPTPMLLVEEGKHGAHARCDRLITQPENYATTHPITIRASTLQRESLLIAELAAADAGLRPATGPSPAAPPLILGERTTLRGEIIDAKCYAGAMTPGDRKAHKACATLCISNGIPAILAVRSADATIAYLCIAPNADILDADSLSKVGEPVEVTGTLGTMGPLHTITIEPGSVTRR
jgi:hypothetical protein